MSWPPFRPPTPAAVAHRLAASLAALSLLPLAQGAPLDSAHKLLGTTWYAVSLQGQRIGYARRKLELDQNARGEPILRLTETMAARLKLGNTGPALSLSSDIVTLYDSALRPTRITVRNNEMGRLRELDATVGEKSIVVVTRAAGEERKESIPLPPHFADDLSLSLAVAEGRVSVGDKLEFDVFSPDTGALDHQTVTVTERKKLQDGRWAFVLKSRSARLGVEDITTIADDGTVVCQVVPALMNMRVEQVSEKVALAEVAPLALSGEIPVERKIEGDPRRLERLQLRIEIRGQKAAEVVPTTARQSVTAEGDAALVTIVRRTSSPPAATLPVTDPALARFLKPTARCQCDDPKIIAKAQEIVGGEKDARRAAERIVLWVFQHMQKTESEPRPLSAREVLEGMEGDCKEHATLCAALAQAVGIPAKFCAGLAYLRGAFYYHAWNELWVGEWVEMDPTWGEVAPDAGHLQLSSGALDDETMAQVSLVAGRTLGSTKIEIRSFRLTPEAPSPAPPREM